MIDPNWQLVDLDPVTWRQIGRFFDPGQYLRVAQAGEHGLFILHERGTIQRVVDSKVGVRHDLISETIDDPQEYAQRLYERGEWQRVHVIDKAHLALVAQSAQATPQRNLTLDQYYHAVYQLLWGDPAGYVSVPVHPGHWHGWTYGYVKNVISMLPFSPATLVLGVFADDKLQIGLLLVCEDGLIGKVTTFEALDAQSFAAGVSEATMMALRQEITQKIAAPAGILLCTHEVFEQWIQQEEKMQVLHAAHEQAQAYWWWAPGLAPN